MAEPRIPEFRSFNAFFRALRTLSENHERPVHGTVVALAHPGHVIHQNPYSEEILGGSLGDTISLVSFYGKLRKGEEPAFREMVENNDRLFDHHQVAATTAFHEGYFRISFELPFNHPVYPKIYEQFKIWHPIKIESVIDEIRRVFIRKHIQTGRPDYNATVDRLTDPRNVLFESNAMSNIHRGPEPGQDPTQIGIDLYGQLKNPNQARELKEYLEQVFSDYPSLHQHRVQLAAHGEHVRIGVYLTGLEKTQTTSYISQLWKTGRRLQDEL